jgi:outer membrane protein TolC
MRRIKIYVSFWSIFLLLQVSLAAQENIDSVLSQIERNNTTLSALRKNAEAEKVGNKTGIYLENPEFGFNYLWVDPSSVGNRTDINIRQSFDFPSAYGYRRQISDFRNTQAELEYLEESRKVLLDARLLCIEMISCNARIEENQGRLANAQELADAYQSMFDAGETGILEYNKVMLNLLNTSKDLEALQIEKSAYLDRLTAMNGGLPIELNIVRLPDALIPPDFDQWYMQVERMNPTLRWLNHEVLVSRQQEKLNRALSLPKASAGYMSENRTGEHFQGVTVGVSIPLWENKNTVKYSQAKALAWQDRIADYKLQLYNQLRIHYNKAASLQKTVDDYRQSLNLYQNTELLKKALDHGEISLLNYLTELTLTYSTIDNYLEAENELNRAVCQLYQYSE